MVHTTDLQIKKMRAKVRGSFKESTGREDDSPYGDMLSATDLAKEPKVVQSRPSWKDGVKV